MVVGGRVIHVVADPPVDVGMADGVPHIVADVTGQVGKPLLPLLPGGKPGKVSQIATEKIIYVVLVHIGAHIPVVPVTENGDVVKKHIRSLKT